MSVEAKANRHVTFRCPFCNCKVRAPRAGIGHQGRCPQCRRMVRVQEPERGRMASDRRLPRQDGLVYMPLPPVNGGPHGGYAGNVLAVLATVCAIGSATVYVLGEEVNGLAAGGAGSASSQAGAGASAIVFGMSILAMGLARALNVIHRQLMENARLHWGPTIQLGGNGH